MARVELSGGECIVLRAAHFSRRFPPHFHDTYAIGVVESGAAIIRTAAGEWTARAGSLLAFAPGEIHSAEPATASGYSYRMMYPSAGLVREIRRGRATNARFRAPVLNDATLARELSKAHGPMMDRVTSSAAEGRLLTGLRTLLSRYLSPGQSGEFGASDADVVERARALLADNFHERVKLDAVAEASGVSAFQLIRVFRRVLGVTPHAYLVQLRVNHAQSMLSAGSRVSDVAYACGFSDQSHLTNAFKRAVGVPPGQFVRQVYGRPA